MEAIGCPEATVRNYHYTLRSIPEERKFHVDTSLFVGAKYKLFV